MRNTKYYLAGYEIPEGLFKPIIEGRFNEFVRCSLNEKGESTFNPFVWVSDLFALDADGNIDIDDPLFKEAYEHLEFPIEKTLIVQMDYDAKVNPLDRGPKGFVYGYW